VGRTAWDLAYGKLFADINRTNDNYNQKLARKERFPDLIKTYVLKAPERVKGNDCDSEKNKTIAIVKFDEEDGPWNKTRFLPKEFLTDNNSCWLGKGYDTIEASVKGDVGMIWIQLDENNVINGLCYY